MSRFVLTAQLQLQAPTNTAQIVRQIQSQLNNVQVNVQVQGTAQATRQVQQVAQSLNAANSAASNLGRTFAISVKRFTALAVATRAVSLFTNTLANATQEAIDFERQLIKVSQVTGQSIGELKGLTKTITTLATGLGVGSKSLLEVSTILLQAGLNANDTEVALKSLAKAALAPNFDSITETAEGAIAILAQFQKGVGALEGQLSSINAVAGAFAVEAGDLIDVIRRTGGVFKASGGSLNELLALFTSVRATTRESAESIGTGLRTIFTRIQRPKTIEFLKQFGVELVDLEGKFVGPFEAVKRLSQALTGLGEGDITFIRIAEELGGFRQIGKVLPLLQQFSIAQDALNVAQKAGNGLTKDAQTAQQALAIRITKVKEEFLALVRSITETSSFQFFANTTLNLASALIRLADALKPIIPLLTAVATIKLAQGLSGFIGGFGRGIGSGRTFNEGGKVLKFARGGMVPGSGNRDTVPAMLQPGEFVIRKSSVNKLGAGNLAAMNDNKYAEGGAIKIKPGAIGGFFLQPEEGIDRKGSSVNEIVQIRGVKALSALGAIDSTDPNVRAEVFKSATTAQQSKILGTKLSSKLSDQISIGGGKTKNIFDKNGKFAKGVGLKADANADNRLTKRIESSSIKLNKDSKLTKNVPLSGNITSYFPGASDMEKNSQVSNAISTTTSNALSNAVKEASNQVKTLFNNNRAITPTNAGINTASQRIANDPNAKKTTEGFIFEGLIQGITGALLSGGQSNFDFPFESISFAKSSLRAMFTDSSGEGIDNLIKADAKRSNTPDALNSIVNKLVNDINKGNLLGVEFTKFAKGSSGKGVQSTKKIGKKRGFFFDFDDTLATTGAIERPGTADPYSDFRGEKGRKLLESAAATRYAAMAKRRASEGHDVWVLTARPGDKDTVSGIKTFGAKNGLMFKGVIGVGGSAGKKGVDTATAKSMILSRYAKNYPDGIIFADDLRENILAAQQQMQRSGVPFKSVVAKKYFGGLIQKFASGGGVGTDTVPALLTPGEFVINKKSAQSIGYGSLNRMNKVGKYASGGVVQKFAAGGQASGGGGGNIFTGLGSQLTLVTASLQALIPPIDENSGAISKVTNNLLNLGTTIGAVIFGLEAFGISLKADNLKNIFGSGQGGLGQTINQNLSNVFNKVTGKLGNFGRAFRATTQATARGGSASAVMNTLQNRGVTGIAARTGGGLGRIAGPISRVFGSLISKISGPLAALSIVSSIVKSFRDLDNQLKDAIKAENVSKAQTLAVSKSNADSIPLIGSLVSAFADLVGGTDYLAGFLNLFGGQSVDQIKTGIATQIQANKAQKALAKASEDSAKALQDFQNGTGSISDIIRSTAGGTREASELRRRTQEQIAANEAQRGSQGIFTFRNLSTLGGLLGETSGQRSRRITTENESLAEQGKKAEEDILKTATPGLQILQRQVAATGGSYEDFLNTLKNKDKNLFDIVMRQGQGELVKGFKNLQKEAERTRAAFNAMNLGFQKVSAVSGALSVGLENYLASQEAGNIGIENNIRTLEASITNAAQGISNSDFTTALVGASNGLRQLGASEAQIKKFEQNLGAINTAQKFFAQASQEVKNTLAANFAAGRSVNMGAVEQRELFANTLVNQLDGVDEITKKRISDAIAGAEISTGDLEEIAKGNLSVLDKVLKDLGETTLNQVIGPLKEYGKYQKALVDLTKKRIEAENNLISAQRGVLEAQLEAQEIISKYGGSALTPQIRTQNAIAQANIQTQGTRVSALRTGSAAELNQRNRETRQRLIEIGNIRTAAAAGNVRAQQQLQGRSGAALEAEQKRLQELAKSDYETTKLLIKNKEEELKLLQEKNKLEKDSIDALISGDMEKFFEQQAAAGAQAAIALGSSRLQGAFGASALGAAAQDIRRQQEAGQQTLFGQQLAGPGGLTERAFGAAIGARGITDPRLAQIAAGTTAEESGVEAQIRELAATLPNYAQTQLESSQQELYASQWQVRAAEMQLQAARANVEASSGGVPMAGMGFAKGGVVYANRGMFVPRGTDTVPAMLTPGEFVVRREAVQRGNNLQLLQSMNRGQSQGSAGTATGMARGGVVNQTQYLAFGGFAKAVSGLLDGDFVGKLTQSFNTFISEMSRNIDKLNSTNFTMKLDTTNVNVNLTGGSFLNKMKDDLREELMRDIANKFSNYKAGEGGNLKENSTVLGR